MGETSGSCTGQAPHQGGRLFSRQHWRVGGKDKLAVIQTSQDLGYCAEKYPNLIPRAISAQFMKNKVIALFELTIVEGEVRIVEERHYCLVPSSSITDEDLQSYANR